MTWFRMPLSGVGRLFITAILGVARPARAAGRRDHAAVSINVLGTQFLRPRRPGGQALLWQHLFLVLWAP